MCISRCCGVHALFSRLRIMSLAVSRALSFTAIFDSGCLIWWGLEGWRNGGLGRMKENKKSGGGDVRAKALSWDEWDKSWKRVFSFFPLAPTVGCFAPHSHPSPPEEKAASRKKSRLRRKKMRLPQIMVHRVYQGCHVPTCGGLPQPTLRGSLLWLRLSPSYARLRLACIELSTIRHLRWLVYPSRRFDKFVT